MKFRIDIIDADGKEISSRVTDYVATAVKMAELFSCDKNTCRLFVKTGAGWEFLGIFESGRQLQGE